MTIFTTLKRSGTLTAMLLAAVVAACALSAAPAMAEFGAQKFVVSARNENGTPDVQAGSHPYSLNTTFVLNPFQGDVKDARVELPPGFVGNPNATPKCGYQEFAKQEKTEPSCADDTAVGVATAYLYRKAGGIEEVSPYTAPVYNLVPPHGIAAEFGFIVDKVTPVLLTTAVRTGGDYGLTTSASDINQAALVLASKVTIWGVPANPEHNKIRGSCERTLAGNNPLDEVGFGLHGEEDELEGPIYPAYEERFSGLPEPTEQSEGSGGCKTEGAEVPLLTNPTSCGLLRTATLSLDSWEEPGLFRSISASLPEISGCESVAFSPTIGVTPEKSTASTPSGFEVAVRVPQEWTDNPNGLAEGDVKSTTVTLPEGVQVNASSANGLQACAQLHGTEPGKERQEENRELTGINLETKWPANCPSASKIANVKVKSPLLEGELEGGMYLAAPQNFAAGALENPFASLLALYLVAEEPKAGVLVKLAGNVTPNPVSGQLTTTFENTPQLPFSELNVAFFGGDRAPLATPALCAGYETQASLTPWSSSEPRNARWSFPIASGLNGGPCSSNPLPFAPSLAAGSTNINAGAFSPLDTTIGRDDGQQSLHNVSLTYPPGVSAILTGVPLCGEAQANAGSCPATSEIGEATASAGLGDDPVTVSGGKVYLTESYGGAPFGLSIVTPATAGPFVLEEGRPVVVRARLEINPSTAAATVTTTGAIPRILDGIPLQIKQVNVDVNRPGFAINGTSCDPMTVTGSIGGWEGASAPASAPFQLANCANLKFQPKIAVATGAHSSKKDGASLNFKLSYPKGALGTRAWFDEAKFVIPKQLPAELKTIQKACLAATFEHDRAACPAHSIIGQAIVYTPVLPVPLTGPVYFVSYGSAKFPDAVLVLNGYGVTVELKGETYIKNGVTSATFRNTPDVPFESLEVKLPTGEYSEFGTNLGLGKYDFCGHKLTVPTFFKAQNGLEVHQETPVAVTGCPKAHKKAKKTSHKKGKSQR